MAQFRVIAISTQTADYVRSTNKAPRYNHPAYTAVATGHGPCRHCLGTFAVGRDKRILFTLDPFDGLEPVPLPGPVFIHAANCERYPEDAGYPEALRSFPAVLMAYANGQQLLAQIHVADGAQEGAIVQLFDRPDVDYIHVRDREAGCYDFRVERERTGGNRGEDHKC
jgi:hypothetical protein